MCLLTICMSSPEKGLFKSFFHFHCVVCGVPPSAPPGGVGGGESSLERSPRRGAPRAGASLEGSQERRGSARGAGARSAKIVLCRADAAPPGRVLLGIGCGSPERGGDSPGSGRPGQSAPGTGGSSGLFAVGAARAGGVLGSQRAAAGNDPSRGSLAPQRHPSAERRAADRR